MYTSERGEAGSELDARGLDLRGEEGRKAGWECSVSRTGADDERRYARAVIGASKRVMICGTWCLSNSAMASLSSPPFFPSTRSSAIRAQRFMSLGPTSRTFRLLSALPLECKGRNAYSGYLRLCSSCAIFALACHFWRSSCGNLAHVRPTIFDKVLWLVSTSDVTT